MQFTSDELEVIAPVKYQPSVSLVLSFEPSIGFKAEVEQKLKLAKDDIRKQLAGVYPKSTWEPVMEKLDQAITSLDVSLAKRSIVVYVSPLLSKAFYLDVPVEEKIVINESFEVRDLIYAKQQAVQCWIMLLSGRRAKAFVAKGNHLNRWVFPVPDNIEAYENDIAERVTNFSDPSTRKELLQDKFMRGIDNALSEMLKLSDLPVFLVGVDRLVGHFKSISTNTNKIVDVIHGNYEEASISELKEVLQPHFEKLHQQRQAALLERISHALKAQKLDVGIHNVWSSASQKLGRLLVVEKNYICAADKDGNQIALQLHDPNNTLPFFIKDAVDDVIEMVIKSGGEVAFVDEGALKDYGRIVLIKYH